MPLIRRSVFTLLGIALLAATSGCDSSYSTDLSYTVGVVRGAVTNGADAPIAGVEVVASSYFPPCRTGAPVVASGTAQTIADGSYRIEITTPTAPTVQCVLVTAGTGTRQAVVAGGQVQFKRAGSLPYDSVRVDVVIP